MVCLSTLGLCPKARAFLGLGGWARWAEARGAPLGLALALLPGESTWIAFGKQVEDIAGLA